MISVVVAATQAGEPPLVICIERVEQLALYRYEIRYDGRRRAVLQGSDLRGPAHGPAPTLRAAAASLAGFLSAAGESLARSGESSEYWDEYSPAAREFLIHTYERLGQHADTG